MPAGDGHLLDDLVDGAVRAPVFRSGCSLNETGGPDPFVLIERNLADIYGISEWNADFPETVDVSFYNRNMRNNLASFPSITEIWST